MKGSREISLVALFIITGAVQDTVADTNVRSLSLLETDTHSAIVTTTALEPTRLSPSDPTTIFSHVALDPILTAPEGLTVFHSDKAVDVYSTGTDCVAGALAFDVNAFYLPTVAEICEASGSFSDSCNTAMSDFVEFQEIASQSFSGCLDDAQSDAKEVELLTYGITTFISYQGIGISGTEDGIARGFDRLFVLWGEGNETAKDALSVLVSFTFDAPEVPAQMAAIPGLNSRVKREILDGLAIVRFRNERMAANNAGLNQNVVPQLIRLLANTDEEVPQLAMARLVAIGSALTEANRAAAVTALEAYRRRNTDAEVQTDIDAALRALRPPRKD